MIKGRNDKDLIEAKEVKKRWQEYTEDLYKSLNDPDSCSGIITHLELDILDCEVKWALGSITKSKASGGNGIPAELFQILKDDAVKVLHQYVSKFGKLSSGHRTGKMSVFIIPIPKKDKFKKCSSYCKSLSLCMPARLCSISFKLSFNSL